MRNRTLKSKCSERTLTSSSADCFIKEAMTSRGIEVIAHKVLVSFRKCFGDVLEVVGILGQPLKVRMLGLILHTPVPPEGTNPT